MPLLIHDTFTGGPEDLADHTADESNVGAYRVINSGGTNILVTGGAAVPQSNSDHNDPGVLQYGTFATRQIYEVQVDNAVGGYIFPLRYDPSISEGLFVVISAGVAYIKSLVGGSYTTLASGSLSMTGVETMTLEVTDDGEYVEVFKNGVSVTSYTYLGYDENQVSGFQFVGDGSAPYTYGSNEMYEYTLVGTTAPREVDFDVDLSREIIIFSDAFDDAPNAGLAEHMPEIDRYKKRWTELFGSFVIDAGSMRPDTAPVSGAYFIGETTGRIEFDLEYDPTAQFNLNARIDLVELSTVTFNFNGGGITAMVFLSNAGVEETCAAGQFLGTAGTYHIRLDIERNTYTLYVDDRRILSFETDFNEQYTAHGFAFIGGSFGNMGVSNFSFTHLPVWFTEPYHHQEIVDALPDHCGAELLTDKDVADGTELNNWGRIAAIIGTRMQTLEADAAYAWKQTSVAYAAGDQLDAVGADYGESRRGRTDAQYRLAIYARMVANNSCGDAASLYAVLGALVPDAEGFNITASNCNLYVYVHGGTFDHTYLRAVLQDSKAAGVGLYAIAAPVTEDSFMFTSELHSAATGFTDAGVGTTYIFEDASADFIAEGVTSGCELVIHGYGAEAGIYYIVAVLSATEIQLSTTVPLGLSSVDYSITEQIPGLGFDEGELSDTL